MIRKVTTSGQGFLIHAVREHDTGPLVVQNGLAVGYFYCYGPEGERFWLIGVHEGDMKWDAPITFTATQVRGGTFDEVDPDDITEQVWGELKLRLLTCSTAEAVLTGLDGEQSLAVVQLAGSVDLECP